MTETTLSYECTPRPFFVPGSVNCHHERFGHFDVSEYRRRSKVRPYGLRMEANPQNREEAEKWHLEAIGLADDLNKMWTYVAGVSLFPRYSALRIVSAPDGWKTNYENVRTGLPATGMTYAAIRLSGGGYSLSLPYMPLGPALKAVQQYHQTNDTNRTLIDLHLEATEQHGTQSGLFLFAKDLELARYILPGTNDAKRQAALPPESRNLLKQPLHWLFRIANTRFEIRHIVTRQKQGPGLLPRLTQSERQDFLHDSDLVIRGVIQRELGITVAVAQQGKPKPLHA